jgi:hypothetical protein
MSTRPRPWWTGPSRSSRAMTLTLALLVLAVLATGCGTGSIDGRYALTLVTEGQHVVGPGETVVGDLVILGGSVTLEPGAEQRGSINVLGGDLDVGGQVGENLTVLGGTATLAGTAVVAGDVTEAGGTLTRAADAVVQGQVVTGPDPATVLGTTARETSPAATAGRFALLVAIMSGLAWLVTRVAARPVRRVAAAASGFPLVSGALGTLVLITAPALLVAMVVTLVLIPVALLVLAVLGVLVAFGLIALGAGVGARIVRRLRWRCGQPAAAAIGTAALVALLQVVSLLSVPGALAVGATFAVATGAVVLTGFGTRTYTPPDDAEDEMAVPRSGT